jgi:hypothetical protein
LTKKATATAAMAGTWKAVRLESSEELCVAIERMDSTMRIKDTDIMIKEKTMLPTVAMRAFP